MATNSKWTRDELILALDLYFRVSPRNHSENHPEVVALSELLNTLPQDTHPDRGPNFRNRNGVYMKLCNFLRFDPAYDGKGLTAGGKMDEVVWNEFAEDRPRLERTAAAIRKAISQPAEEAEAPIPEDEEFPEGRLLTRLHQRKERSAKLVAKKKEEVLKGTGAPSCEVCGFDFETEYGAIGNGFAECHHKKPVSELDPGTKTKLSDLAIVCANCHRMLHRVRPWLTIQKLQEQYTNQQEKF